VVSIIRVSGGTAVHECSRNGGMAPVRTVVLSNVFSMIALSKTRYVEMTTRYRSPSIGAFVTLGQIVVGVRVKASFSPLWCLCMTTPPILCARTPVTAGAYMIMTRNPLYTAVTRAKQLVVLVGRGVVPVIWER
jgi:hypothetical protein